MTTGLAFIGAFTVVLILVPLANLERTGAPSLSTSSFGADSYSSARTRTRRRFNADDVALVGGVEAPRTLGLVVRKLPQTSGDAHYGAGWAPHADSA